MATVADLDTADATLTVAARTAEVGRLASLKLMSDADRRSRQLTITRHGSCVTAHQEAADNLVQACAQLGDRGKPWEGTLGRDDHQLRPRRVAGWSSVASDNGPLSLLTAPFSRPVVARMLASLELIEQIQRALEVIPVDVGPPGGQLPANVGGLGDRGQGVLTPAQVGPACRRGCSTTSPGRVGTRPGGRRPAPGECRRPR